MLIHHVTRTNDISDNDGHPVTASVDAQIQATVADLHKHGVGILPVCRDDGTLCGVISERDIMRGLAQHGPAALEMTTGDLMTKDVVTCTNACSVKDIVDQMAANGFRHMPVVDGDKPVGVVSSKDVMAYLAERLSKKEFTSMSFWI
jgi:CBS domain-containing protein